MILKVKAIKSIYVQFLKQVASIKIEPQIHEVIKHCKILIA